VEVQVHDHQEQVRDFMRAMGQDIPKYPIVPSPVVLKLRVNLIDEEFKEFMDALPDSLEDESNVEILSKIADSIADLLYVVYGAAVAFGIDIHPILDEIHRSNMTKFDGVIRSDGKVLKGASYDPPRVTNILNYQVSNGLNGLNYGQLEMVLRGGIEYEIVAPLGEAK
jgi:predicted HAD superfamily Cof-like phosphohydrolase